MPAGVEGVRHRERFHREQPTITQPRRVSLRRLGRTFGRPWRLGTVSQPWVASVPAPVRHVSMPGPPISVSAPGPPLRTSSPSFPRSVSAPSWPLTSSLPAPPSMMSSPLGSAGSRVPPLTLMRRSYLAHHRRRHRHRSVRQRRHCRYGRQPFAWTLYGTNTAGGELVQPVTPTPRILAADLAVT